MPPLKGSLPSAPCRRGIPGVAVGPSPEGEGGQAGADPAVEGPPLGWGGTLKMQRRAAVQRDESAKRYNAPRRGTA